MESQYETLKVLYSLVQDKAEPTRHLCHPNEIILQHHYSWDIVVEHFNQLHREGLIKMESPGTTVINITDKGMDWVKENTI